MARNEKTRFLLKRVFSFRKKVRKSQPLTEREEMILKREMQESQDHALPDAPSNNSYGDGSFTNNISRIQATTNQNGLGSIAERRVFEPRSGQYQSDQESL
jgi:hypothetical protein